MEIYIDEFIFPTLEPDHQEVCPKCGKMANIFFLGNNPDNCISELNCPYCKYTEQD